MNGCDIVRLIFYSRMIYEKAKAKGTLDHSMRNQSLGVGCWFPKRKDGLCSCGCGRKAKIKWLEPLCSHLPYIASNMIGYPGEGYAGLVVGVRDSRNFSDGKQCKKCGSEKGLQLDHIVEVADGGGGCWIDNLQWLCSSCHGKKSGYSRAMRNRAKKNNGQTSLFAIKKGGKP